MNIRRQVKLKMKLERTFKREISKVFNFMLMDFKLSVFKNTLFNVYDYQGLWRDLLKKHYSRVQRNFVNLDGKKIIDSIDEQNIKLALDTWADEMSDKVSSEITRTSLDDVRIAMIQAQENSEERLTQMELALAAAILLKRRFNGRKNTIATTETNGTAENAKLTEKKVKGTIITERIRDKKVPIKTWHNVGDKRVREAHIRAEGQTMLLDTPFSVGGELMMYPSDRSMGASIGNIINCRCTLSYSSL